MKKIVFLLLAGGLFATGCAVEVTSSVPAEPVEVRPAPPFAGAIWIGADYRWERGHYTVVSGRWERPRGEWISGRWQQRRGGYRWVRGHWR